MPSTWSTSPPKGPAPVRHRAFRSPEDFPAFGRPVLAPGHEGSPALVQELQEHCRTVTAPYKYPREIEFTADLPKTISGKIRRVELREREQAAAARPAPG